MILNELLVGAKFKLFFRHDNRDVDMIKINNNSGKQDEACNCRWIEKRYAGEACWVSKFAHVRLAVNYCLTPYCSAQALVAGSFCSDCVKQGDKSC